MIAFIPKLSAEALNRRNEGEKFSVKADGQLGLLSFQLEGEVIATRPAPVDRDWMDATGEGFAYRCLPLSIANAHGWELLTPRGFAAGWTGAETTDGVVVQGDGGTQPPASSHFGHGILTFHVPAIFRTDPGYDLWIQGPVNRPKDGIYALSAVVETDWSVATFTMNWKFTRPGVLLRFEPGEPFCHIFPVKRGDLERVDPSIAPLAEAPELERAFQAWSASRQAFNSELAVEGSEARSQRWQKDYTKGRTTAGDGGAPQDHRTRLRLKPFSGSVA